MKSTVVFRFFVSLLAVSVGLGSAAVDKPKHTFESGRRPGQIDHVTVQLKVGGEVFDIVNRKEQREKMNVACNLDYTEKTLAIPRHDEDHSRSIRYYNQTEAAIKIGDLEFKPALRPQRALIAVEITPQKSVIFSPAGTLTNAELELIEHQGNSLLMDRFLPDQPMAVGDSWKHSERLMALLLNLDEVGQTDVQSVLTEVTDKVARFEMSGKVAGAIDGVTSEIEIKARYRFDLMRKRIDWLGMLIKEKRQSSPVSDGIDATAQVQMTILPAKQSEHLSQADLKDLPLESTPQLLRLSHFSQQGGWEIVHNRSWRVYRDLPDAAVLRRIERGELIAQCNLSSLPPGKPDKLVSLEEFQEDVKQALAKEFKEFVEAGQTVDQASRRVLRVVARGTAADLPILWNYYHLADPEGRQMGCVFTIEEKYAKRFGLADQELLEGLRFVEPNAEKSR